MSPTAHRVHGWYADGNTGTVRQVAEALGIPIKSVENVIKPLRDGGLLRVIGSEASHYKPSFVYAVGRVEPEKPPQPASGGGPILAQALRSRTPLERAWV